MLDTKAEWEHDLPRILKSSRVAEMTFHVPKVDKDKEIISAEAMVAALEDYRHFPIISEFHKERPIGVAEKIWQTTGDEFKARVRIREDPSVDDVWDKMNLPDGTPGKYNQVSIAGRRTEFSSECNLHQSQRSEFSPCRTTGLRLDSISVCDDAARNTSTNLSVVKAGSDDPTVFVYTTSLELKQVKDTLIKAETSESNLIHPVTDGTKRRAGEKGDKMKECDKPPVEKAEDEEKEEKKESELADEKEIAKKGEAGSPEKEEMEKAPEPEKEEEETEKAEDPYQEILKILRELVASDKKVHTTMKSEEEKPEEKEEKEEKKVEKAAEELPPPTPAVTTITKAEMEQDFQKALDAALTPIRTELDEVKKALEGYANDPIVKSGLRLQLFPLNVDNDGKPILGNAGAMAAATQPKEANK